MDESSQRGPFEQRPRAEKRSLTDIPFCDPEIGTVFDDKQPSPRAILFDPHESIWCVDVMTQGRRHLGRVVIRGGLDGSLNARLE